MYPRGWPAWEALPLGFPRWVLWILIATIYWTIAIFQMLWQGFLVMIILILRATLWVENWHPHSWMKLAVMCPWPWAKACKSQDLNPLGSDLTQSFESLTIFTKPLWGSYNFLQVSRLQSKWLKTQVVQVTQVVSEQKQEHLTPKFFCLPDRRRAKARGQEHGRKPLHVRPHPFPGYYLAVPHPPQPPHLGPFWEFSSHCISSSVVPGLNRDSVVLGTF